MEEKKYPIGDGYPQTPEMDLILRIVAQFGNAIEMVNMEGWLKEYAKQRYADIERIELGIKDGLPEHEASFQSGYTSGHETGYERGKREAQSGAGEASRDAEAVLQRIRDFNLSDLDAPVFTHTKEFQAHFSYIKGKLMEVVNKK